MAIHRKVVALSDKRKVKEVTMECDTDNGKLVVKGIPSRREPMSSWPLTPWQRRMQ